jgi:catechol 2,3-dioxygenase-like lactoylglutathione lyase family enzyme
VQLRLSLLTLGVADIARSRAFYEGLGLTASSESKAEVAFFQLGSVVLALFGRSALAADAHVADSTPGFSGIAMAWNVASAAEVDAALAKAASCGGRIVKSGQKVFWGGYSGYFADPDGHLWEVAHNPFWTLDASGRVTLPDDPQMASHS